MKFKDAPVGTILRFSFDKQRDWWYVKTGTRDILCIKTPSCHSKAMGGIQVIESTTCESEIEIGQVKKEGEMNLHQIESQIQQLRINLQTASEKVSAIVNRHSYRPSLVHRDCNNKIVRINSLFDEETWKVFEQRARNEHKAAEKAITDFEKKFA